MKTSIVKSARRLTVLLALLTIWLVPSAVRASDESDVRGTVQSVFQQLKSRDYAAIYDSLPAASRKRMTRDRFASALRRAQDRYVLESINIGTVRVSGNIAVADTELFGRVSQPFPAEGKIVVQQYLVREDGKWRVATGDTGTIQRFLKANPGFARKFPIRQPRVYVKQNNQWIEMKMGR